MTCLGVTYLGLSRLLAALLLTLLLSGCKTALLTQLSELDANDALYTLLQGGVDAEKRPDAEGAGGGGARFALWVPKDEQAQALALLKAQAQPEFKHATLGELFGRNQLISTPGEERIRFVYGIEQALAQTLSKIDGVLVARVHIVLPLNDPLAKEMKPASASVFIKHRSGQDLSADVPAIKELVVRGIEGLSLERVAVTLFGAGAPGSPGSAKAMQVMDSSAAAARFLGLSVPGPSVSGLWLRVLAAAGLGGLAALALTGKRVRLKALPAATKGAVPRA